VENVLDVDSDGNALSIDPDRFNRDGLYRCYDKPNDDNRTDTTKAVSDQRRTIQYIEPSRMRRSLVRLFVCDLTRAEENAWHTFITKHPTYLKHLAATRRVQWLLRTSPIGAEEPESAYAEQDELEQQLYNIAEGWFANLQGKRAYT
jgi:hypothetical protein